MKDIILLSLVPLGQLSLWVLWLYVIGFILKDSHSSYGKEYEFWDTSAHGTTITIILLWTAVIYAAHVFLTGCALTILHSVLFSNP